MISTAPMELPCPECGATASRQISGGAGFAFKGSGFYLTDYGKNAHRGTAPGKKGSGEAGGGGDSGKSSEGKGSEAKPAGDTTAKSSGDSATKPAATEKPAAAKPPKPKSE
jgi:predicted nucleic acid-binding Zn ribbon protein